MPATFSITSDDAVKHAMKLCGALGVGETANPTELTDGRTALNIMLKAWADQGYKGWLYQTSSFAFVASKEFWTLGEAGADVTMVRPERIAQAWWEDTASPANKTPMTPCSREEFQTLTPRLQTGSPTNWYYDPQISLGRFYPWPLCQNTSGTFFISIQRPINDLTAGASTFDCPQVLYRAIVFNLASEWGVLAFRCDERTARRIESRANQYLYDAMNYLEEDASIFLQPSMEGGAWFGGMANG